MVHTSHRPAGGRADLASPDRLSERNARSPSAHRGAHHGGHECPVCSAVRDHDDWNTEVRGETPLHRADRAYGEILQEIRVAQTGVQIRPARRAGGRFRGRFARSSSLLRRGFEPGAGLVRPIQRFQSGVINDYVTWTVIGIACLGGALAFSIR
jgi:hypothetical protein